MCRATYRIWVDGAKRARGGLRCCRLLPDFGRRAALYIPVEARCGADALTWRPAVGVSGSELPAQGERALKSFGSWRGTLPFLPLFRLYAMLDPHPEKILSMAQRTGAPDRAGGGNVEDEGCVTRRVHGRLLSWRAMVHRSG